MLASRNSPEARREQRISLMRRVRIRIGRDERDATILDASSRGLLMTAAQPPQRGEIIEVQIGNQVVVGQVSWSRPPQFGVTLRERLDAAGLAAGRAGVVREVQPAVSRTTRHAPAANESISDKWFLIGAAVASIGFLAIAFRAWI